MRTLPLQTETPSQTLVRPGGRVRWMICALLFFATTVNYIDRQVLSVLKPMLETQLNWSEADYGWIVFAFQTAYALMMPVAGRFIDWAGTRLGYALAVLLWSLAAMSHSLRVLQCSFPSPVSPSESVKRRTFQPPFERLPIGFRKKNDPSQQASSTAVLTLESSSRPYRRLWPFASDGRQRS
jgi:hypothetical protein